VAKVTVGFALLPVGVALLVLPGPGIPVVAASLALLEDEFGWAGKARRHMSNATQRGLTWLQEKAAARKP
jgi:hypothetical protein